MSNLVLRQKCPMCDVILDYEVLHTGNNGLDDDGNATFTIEAQTTKESTAHVWTHAPKAGR